MFGLACKAALVSDRVVYEEGLTFADPAYAPAGLLQAVKTQSQTEVLPRIICGLYLSRACTK